MTKQCCRVLHTHSSRRAKQKRHRQLRRPRESKRNRPPATVLTASWERRKKSKQQTAPIRQSLARRSKNYSRRIRAARCCSVVSVRHTVQTTLHARSNIIVVHRRFSPTLPTMHLVTLLRWSRRVAF